MAHQTWQVQKAKADLSGLIRAAHDDGPQTITRHGEAVAVVLSADDYEQIRRREHARRGSLLDFFSTWPSLDIPRRDRTDVGREVNL